ncbi:hypothetical protein AL346_00125 [Chelatococcus sp. CO-6]|nr:hypothetical protein AL346_00125 [Chelatococcus sp. CO-6]
MRRLRRLPPRPPEPPEGFVTLTARLVDAERFARVKQDIMAKYDALPRHIRDLLKDPEGLYYGTGLTKRATRNTM